MVKLCQHGVHGKYQFSDNWWAMTSSLVHLFLLFFGESFAHGLQKSFQLLSWDHLCIFGVEAFEGVSDDVFGAGTVELLTEEGEEGGEVDISGRFLDHVFQVLCWGVFSHGGEHTGQIVLGDETVTVLVDHVEGFLEFLDLRLREQSEDIGGGLLGLLLSGSLLFAHFCKSVRFRSERCEKKNLRPLRDHQRMLDPM